MYCLKCLSLGVLITNKNKHIKTILTNTVIKASSYRNSLYLRRYFKKAYKYLKSVKNYS